MIKEQQLQSATNVYETYEEDAGTDAIYLSSNMFPYYLVWATFLPFTFLHFRYGSNMNMGLI